MDSTDENTYTIANACCTVLPRLEGMDQRDEYPATRVPDSMPKGDSATVYVNLIGADTQDLFGSTNDDRESLVDFKQ